MDIAIFIIGGLLVWCSVIMFEIEPKPKRRYPLLFLVVGILLFFWLGISYNTNPKLLSSNKYTINTIVDGDKIKQFAVVDDKIYDITLNKGQLFDDKVYELIVEKYSNWQSGIYYAGNKIKYLII